MTKTEAQQVLTDNSLDSDLRVSDVLDGVVYVEASTYYGPWLDFKTFDSPAEFASWAANYDGAE